MKRIIDPTLAAILESQSAPDFPSEVVSKIYRKTRLLLAANDWTDIGVFTRVAALPDGRFAAPAHGKWFIVFNWTHIGADRLELQLLA